jgi:hypothetical protein
MLLRPLILLALLGSLAGCALAQPTQVVAQLPSAPTALAPFEGGVAALLTDGRLVAVGPGGVRTLRRGLDGEVLVACAGRLLAIDDFGRLAIVTGPGATDGGGPAVSLHATPLCLPDGDLATIDPNGGALLRLAADGTTRARIALPALPDAAPVRLPDGTVALPIEPTLRYRHGVLGDEVEAAGVGLVDLRTGRVVDGWSLPGERVVEERRLVPFPAAGVRGLVATVSGAGDGGALLVLAAPRPAPVPAGPDGPLPHVAPGSAAGGGSGRLAPVAVAAGLGQEQEQRWRHVLGASGRRLYTVAAPHLRGPLERWTLVPGDDVLDREAFDLGVTSHREGSREMDLGQLLPAAAGDPPGLDLLLLPGADLTDLRLVACDDAGCRVAAVAELGGTLAAAPVTSRSADGSILAWAATEAGRLLRLRFPRDGILTDSE